MAKNPLLYIDVLRLIREEANKREKVWEEESIITIKTELENNAIKVFNEDFMTDLGIQANDPHCSYLEKTNRYTSESVKSQLYNKYGINSKSTLWKRIPNFHNIYSSNSGILFYVSSLVRLIQENKLNITTENITSQFPMIEIKIGTELPTYNQSRMLKK